MKPAFLNPTVSVTIEMFGLGRKTPEEIRSEKGLSLNEVLSGIKLKRIEAKPIDQLNEIAIKQGKTPLEIF